MNILEVTELPDDDATTPPQEPEVAPAAPTRLRQVIPHGDAKAIVRAVRDLLQVDVGVMPVCLTCLREKRPEMIQWGRSDASGEMVMHCVCTVRVLQGVRK